MKGSPLSLVAPTTAAATALCIARPRCFSRLLIQRPSTQLTPRTPTSFTPHHLRTYAAAPRPPRLTRASKVRPDRLPQNEEITDDEILIVEPDGSLSGPHDPRVIVSRLDLRTYVLRPPPPPPPPEPRPALCRIVNKAEEYQAMKAAKLQKREDKEKGKGKKRLKEVEMSWSIGHHDLERKTRQVIGFLQKGMKVEIIIAKKKGAKKGSEGGDAAGEMKEQAVVDKIRDMIAHAPGTAEPKAPSGVVGRTLRLFFEGHILKPGEEGEMKAADETEE